MIETASYRDNRLELPLLEPDPARTALTRARCRVQLELDARAGTRGGAGRARALRAGNIERVLVAGFSLLYVSALLLNAISVLRH